MAEDDRLSQQIHEGDQDALAEFLQAQRGRLIAFLDRRMGAALKSKIEADDLFQDLAADAVRRLDQARPPANAVFSWLCQIGEQRLIDAHRHFSAGKRASHREVAIDRSDDQGEGRMVDLLVSSVTSPSRVLSRNIKEVKMLDALEQLPDEQRNALKLRYIQKWPTKKIADELGKSDAAIRVMLSRSLRKLQDMIDLN